MELATLVFAMILPTIITYIYFVALADADSGTQQFAGGALKLLQFALPLFWAWRFGRSMGWLRPTSIGLAAALAFGVVSALLLIWLHRPVLHALGDLVTAQDAVQKKVGELGFISRGRYVGLAAFYTIAHSLLEEYYWRWCVFGGLRSYMKASLANIVSSLAFMAHHVIVLGRFFGATSLTTWFCSLGVGFGGAVWAWMYQRTGYLFPGWVSHALIDAAIFYVGYRFLFE